MIVLTVAIILRLKIGRLIPRKIAVVKSLFLLTAYKFQFLAAAKLNRSPRREAETSVRRQLQLMIRATNTKETTDTVKQRYEVGDHCRYPGICKA